ncbi:MAG: DUF1385 domain-containing protein [Oscillospiraceae bacterium]|nr:DUF1385 domain-containing protein [Oscillospiraceae bacterium]MCD8192448.1 DUF1385 domain-containing protein [Oscillospiraceae bacterium]MCD8343943.1 DUF1385 domain-containing protein [Oscillospiraceae bacterium]
MSKKETGAGCAFRTSIGGQALMEGILMRGVDKQASVCRKDDGSLVTKVDELHLIKEKYPVLGWPFIRGVVNFVDSMAKGMGALLWSMEQLPEEEQGEPDKLDLWIEKHFGGDKAEKVIIAVGVTLGILLAVGLFVLLPAFIFELLPDSLSLVLRCIIEGVLRIVIFLLYMWLCTRTKEIQRMFSYHGAEHKTIFCYEKGLELTVENVRPQSRFHPRCGTSFLLVIMIISIFVMSFMTWVLTLFPSIAELGAVAAALVRMCCKLIMLPIVVGITYELNRWVGRHDNIVSSILAWPGKQLQHLTVFEPDDGMIECAIEAMKLVIPEQKGADEW